MLATFLLVKIKFLKIHKKTNIKKNKNGRFDEEGPARPTQVAQNGNLKKNQSLIRLWFFYPSQFWEPSPSNAKFLECQRSDLATFLLVKIIFLKLYKKTKIKKIKMAGSMKKVLVGMGKWAKSTYKKNLKVQSMHKLQVAIIWSHFARIWRTLQVKKVGSLRHFC